MNTSVSAYTTLESLLLFQGLYAYGLEHNVFSRISDQLKRNPDITSHRHFQGGRLSPDALRNFYLERLRREIEYEQGDHDGEANGDVTNPRKRKKASPVLPTVNESLQHQHLIPKLVNKLYASFRKEVVELIRAEEDRYEKLQREIQSIERGEWDEQLKERANGRTPASRSPTLPRKSPHLAQKPLPPIASPQLGQNGARGNAPTPDGTLQHILEPPRAQALQNGQAATSPRKQQPALDQRPSNTTPQPIAASPQPHPAQPLAPPPPRFQQPPSQPYNTLPYPNPPYPPVQQPPTPHSAPLQPSPHQHQARPPHPLSPFAGPPASPHPPQPVQPYGGNGVPQYGAPPGAPSQYTPGHQRFPPPPPGPQSPGMQAQHPQYRPQYAHPSPQPYPHHAPQYPPPPPQAGFMLPPFQVSLQEPSRVPPQSAATPHHPQVSTPVSNRQQPPSRTSVHTPGTGRPGVPAMHALVTQARQSFSTPLNDRSPLSAMGTPVSARSLWKKALSFAGTPMPSPRPIPEPIDDFVPSGTPKASPSKPKSQRKSRAKGKGKEKETEHDSAEASAPVPATPSEPQPEESIQEPETRSGRSRRKAAPKRTRPGSLASSRAADSVRDRSRSQSILSHTETIAADNESQAGHRIKSERGNSVDAVEEDAADTPSQMTTRRGAASRRKRTARDASLDGPEDQFSTPGPPRTITAPRYFARTCAPIMNDIQSHKHASTFSSAVRPKDAEGYYEIIKRPTDLKSIQKAIGIGAKQVTAAASDTPIGSPGGGGGVVELPVISDNMPPKSIVNAAQLEKELMRMFVNAVMFNPGEDGVVEDAREMFETVQRSVSSWRNVERSSGRMEVEDTPTVEDEEAPPLQKRRKV